MANGPEKPPAEEMVLGEVMSPFGFKGELRIFLYNPEGRWDGTRSVVLVDAQGRRREVLLSLRPGAGKRIIGKVQGFEGALAIEPLLGSTIVVARAALPVLEEGTYYQADLVGLRVRTESGQDLGVLTAIHDQGEVDVWEIRDAEGRFRYVPAEAGAVLAVRPGEGVTVSDEVGAQDAF